ncbi:MAG: menaquinone-dependent protoporphyrinogen IX dehydrogenase [Candidatus Pelagibacter sp.]|nr:menaquinone-dependent protoporphyrinogen IX dehydrogenase [Candidatus Pelagibacter sp.]|tara:strand:+ start:9060 stop:9587 length:528 start_codon:yes stop_codon:yes gene_type:complete
MKSVIIYSSTDGQTKKICEVIRKNLLNKDEHKLISIDNVSDINLESYDSIIIGASIRYGKHNTKIINFVKKNLNLLQNKKNAFFSVNVVARKKGKDTPETNPYVQKFLNKTKWKPSNISVFAGKVDYPKYNILNKYVIRFIMLITRGPTDTTKTYEFTNWDNVKNFAKEINENFN